MGDEVQITIDGLSYTGWETVSIQRGLTSLSGSFDIGMADEQTGKDWRLAAQKACEIKIGKDKVLTGFIDAVEFSVDDTSHEVSLRGRDITADIVDCAVVADKKANPFAGTIKQSDVGVIAKNLTAPFGLAVKVLTAVGEKFARFTIQRGETVFEAVDRACKQRGVIAVTNPEGNLQITVSGESRAEDVLRYGVNVKKARAAYDYTDRFSHYRVDTQGDNAGGAVGATWKGTTNVTGTYTDRDVARFRPTVLQAEAEATKAACKTRAATEALYRAASSQTFEVAVAGWRQSGGNLWRVNQTVNVDIPPLYVKDELLIAGLRYELSKDDGSQTVLTLLRKDAFNTARALEALAIKETGGSKLGWK